MNDRIKEFSQTSMGRIVILAIPALVLTVIIGFIAVTMLRGGEAPDVETAAVRKEAPASGTEKKAGSAEKDATETAADDSISESTEAASYVNADLEVYDTRDPFEPVDASATISGLPIPDATSSPNMQSSAGPVQVLSLKGIEEDADGVLYADVTYGASPFLVKSGDQVGNSPYKVVSVAEDGATFLYGDDELALQVGESAGK